MPPLQEAVGRQVKSLAFVERSARRDHLSQRGKISLPRVSKPDMYNDNREDERIRIAQALQEENTTLKRKIQGSRK